MNPPPCSPQLRPTQSGLDEHPAQAGAIEAARPLQLRPVPLRPAIVRSEENLRLGTPREDVDVGRPMIVEKDDETQISSAMDGRLENNPSDGLFK